MSPPQHPSLAAAYNRDSTAVRASVFDACLQLGALDENSLVGQWMFNDPSTDSTKDSLQAKNRTTRFQETVSGDWSKLNEQNQEPPRRRRFFPFSVFSARRRHGSSARWSQEHDPETVANPSSSSSSVHDIGPGHVSLNRRSFFRRSIDKHAARSTPASTVSSDRLSSSQKSFFSRHSIQQQQHTVDQANTSEDGAIIGAGGRISTNPRSFFQLKPSTLSSSIPLGPVPEDDDDDEEEWEEIEARPRSPLYPLHNKGINPPAVTPDNKNKKRHSEAAGVNSTTDTPTSLDTDAVADAAQVDIQGAKVQRLSFAIPRLTFRRRSLEHGHGRDAHDQNARQRHNSSPSSPSEPRSRSRTWSWSRASRGSPPNRKRKTPSPTSTPTPTPPHTTPSSSLTGSPRKPRKRKSKPSHLRVFTGRSSSAARYHHHRSSHSGSISPGPNSPFVLLTTDNTSTMPQPTSRIVFSDEDNPLPVPPAADSSGPNETTEAALAQNDASSGSMGYHHQFFVDNNGGADNSVVVVEPALPALPPQWPPSPSSPHSPHSPSPPISPTYTSSSPGSPGSTRRRRRLTKTRGPKSAAVAASNPSATVTAAVALSSAPSEAVVPIRPPKRASGGPVLRKRVAVPFPSSLRQ